MRKLLISLTVFLLCSNIFAQDYGFIFDMPNDFENIDTLAQPKQFKSIHMIGVKYGVNYSGVKATPKIGEEYVFTYNNISVLYTYYHALWDHLFNFGIQTGVKHGYEGYSSPYNGFGEICEIAEIPLISQFKIDFSRFRLLVNLGTYGGYRLSTDKEGGFDQYDQRVDYGIIGGAGLALVVNPFELHIEANYKYSLASMYHTYKYSDIYWLYAYPMNIMASAALYIHLW